MTSAQFMKEFQDRLIVGEPKRASIIREIESHLHAGKLELGNPVGLARKLNRVHLGWLCSENRIAVVFILLPLLGTLLTIFHPYYQHASYWSWIDDEMGFVFFFYIMFAAPTLLALWFGRTIAVWYKAARLFRRAWIMVVLFAMACGLWKDLSTGLADIDVPDTITGLFFSSLYTAILTTLFFAAFAMIGMFLRTSSPLRRAGEEQRHVKIQIALAIASLAVLSTWLFEISTLVTLPKLILVHAPGFGIAAWLIVYIVRKVMAFRNDPNDERSVS